MSITKIYKIKVEWGDCDPYGIVFYPNFYKWMDSSQWNYFNKIKQPITRLEKIYGIVGLPLLHTEATYIAACYREDLLKVETTLVKITKSTLKLEHVIKRKDKTVCYGYETRIWAKNIGGRIVSEHIPREIRTVFNQYLSNETAK
ncbi:MAG: acyl-CoA thioesterase [Pelagibacterales bacterium]|jgi:4-hydroxybenzoyl-CoA thioesterase|nr:acyl-CoA thioesterase [Pelagibacterales bacterium]MBT7077428.1 acyl-CoA thioesterase [Pelagibacterales bacterium]MDG2267445.1 thioesterase family protein [Alphaproteobacteria bacterium]|tara:strand:- start:452 stop:886 length:435 start_codon:yes stop_codon:yes gene_type:complete